MNSAVGLLIDKNVLQECPSYLCRAETVILGDTSCISQQALQRCQQPQVELLHCLKKRKVSHHHYLSLTHPPYCFSLHPFISTHSSHSLSLSTPLSFFLSPPLSFFSYLCVHLFVSFTYLHACVCFIFCLFICFTYIT